MVIRVSYLERSKHFYAGLGSRLDADFANGGAFRVVQFTPPGSATSAHFGMGVTPAAAGSARGYLVVSDIEATSAEVVTAGAQMHRTVPR